MAKANTEILGAVGQVAEEEHVIRISAKRLKNYLIIAGSILLLISAVAVFALVGGKSKDVAGSSGVASEKTTLEKKAIKTAEGMTLVTGPFSEQEMSFIAADGLVPILRREAMDDNVNKHTRFNEPACSAKYLSTEKGVDNNGVSRKIHVVEVHIVGDYYSKVDEMNKSFEVTFIANVLKTSYGMGYKILNTEVVDWRTAAM